MKEALIILLLIPLLGISQVDTTLHMCEDMYWIENDGNINLVVNDTIDLNMGEVWRKEQYPKALVYELYDSFYISLKIFFKQSNFREMDFFIIETIDGVGFYEVLPIR